MVLVLRTPSRSRILLTNRNSKFRPWLLCNSIVTPKRQKFTKTLATVDASWFGMACTSGHCKVIHGNQEVPVSPVTLREGPNDVNGDSVEGCPDVILVHQTPTPGPVTSNGGAGVALLAPSLDVVSQPQSIVALPDFIHFYSPQGALRTCPVQLRQDLIHVALRGDYLGHLFPSADCQWHSNTPSINARDFHWAQ